MRWRERAAQIKSAAPEPQKPKEEVDSVNAVPTPTLSDLHGKLTQLVYEVAKHEGWSHEDTTEALDIAWAEPDAWIAQFELLIKETSATRH